MNPTLAVREACATSLDNGNDHKLISHPGKHKNTMGHHDQK